MMRSKLVVLLGALVALGIAGCGDDDEEPFVLDSGRYVIESVTVDPDSCGVAAGYEVGTEFDITVGENGEMTFADIKDNGDLSDTKATGTVDNNAFDLTGTSAPGDVMEGVDCKTVITKKVVGDVTGDNVVDGVYTWSEVKSSGAECAETGITFPCESKITFTASKKQ